jgi:competence protein ComEA
LVGVSVGVSVGVCVGVSVGVVVGVSVGVSVDAAAGSSVASLKAGAACPPTVAVNRATREELLCLPGIGAVLAGRILAEREAHGPFRDTADLARVQGLGPSRREKLRGRITIP